MMHEYAKYGNCGWVHVVIKQEAAEASAAGLDGHVRCQRCGADGFMPAHPRDVPPLTQVRGIVMLSKKERK